MSRESRNIAKKKKTEALDQSGVARCSCDLRKACLLQLCCCVCEFLLGMQSTFTKVDFMKRTKQRERTAGRLLTFGATATMTKNVYVETNLGLTAFNVIPRNIVDISLAGEPLARPYM